MLVIPLGCNCEITWILKKLNLKKETTLFEYFLSYNFNSIVDIINKIHKSIESVSINKSTKYINMESDNIVSGHYALNDYIPIFKRRSERFINAIKNNNQIIFIRLCIEDEKLNIDDVISFISIICSMNSTLDFKLIIIERLNNINNFIEIKYEHLIHKCVLYNDEINTDNLINHYNKTHEYNTDYIEEVNKCLTSI